MSEKDKIDLLVGFLEWIDKVRENDPMRLETDYEDLVMMYLEEKSE